RSPPRRPRAWPATSALPPGARRAAGPAGSGASAHLRCYARGMPTTRTLSATFIKPGPDAGDRLQVRASTESGFELGFDTLSASEGGIGPGPTESVLASLAACTAMDVASI